MKKLLLGVITFALIITSCNKYADDFAALKDQIAALALQVNGVIQLQADLTAAKAQITALQAAVATLPTATTVTGQFTALNTALAAVGTKIDAITTTLGAVASAGTATKAVVDKLAVDLAQMKVDKTAADKVMNDKLDALKVQLALAATSAEVQAIQAEILKQLAASAATTDANVTKKIADAVEAIKIVINAGLDATNTNVDTKIAAAKLALEEAILAAIADINEATAEGLLVTNQKIEDAKAALKTLIEEGIISVNENTDKKVTALERALKTLIEAGNNVTLAKIQTTLEALQGDPTNTDKTKLTIQGLQLALQKAQDDITIILNSTAMYNDDVILTSNDEVISYLEKLDQMAVINGNLVVNPLAITNREDLKKILDKIQTVIAYHEVEIVSVPADKISLPILRSVSGGLMIWGAPVSTPVLAAVGEDLVLGYNGAYEIPSLKTVGGAMVFDITGEGNNDHFMLAFPNNEDDKGVTQHWVVTKINFPNVVMTRINGSEYLDVFDDFSSWYDGHDHNDLQLPPSTKSVVLGDTPIDAVSGDSIATIILGTEVFENGLTVVAPLATTLDLSKAKESLGDGTDGLKLTIAIEGTVNLAKFVDCVWPVTIEGPINISIPLWTGETGGEFVSTTATTVSLGKYDWSTPATMPAVEHLTLGAVNNQVDLTGGVDELLTAEITGKPVTEFSTVTYLTTLAGVNIDGTASAPGLKTLALNGVLRGAIVQNADALTSLTTSGIINNLQVRNCDNTALKTLGLAHTHFAYGPGTSLIIDDNASLTSLTTSTNYPRVIQITNNPLLATLSLASNTLHSLSAPTAVTGATAVGTLNAVVGQPFDILENQVYWIYGNKLSGTYTPSVPTSGAGAFVEAKISSAALLPIKNLISKITATGMMTTYGTGYTQALNGFNLSLQIENVPPVTPVTLAIETLTMKMQADRASGSYPNVLVYPAYNQTAPNVGVIDDVVGQAQTHGINTAKEAGLLN